MTIPSEIHAYVLQKRQASAEKVFVTFFSQEKGRFSVWVKFKAKDKTRALYEPFMPLWILLETAQNWPSIKSLELEPRMSVLTGEALWCGWYLNELLMYLLRPDEVNEGLYQAYQETLHALSQAAVNKQVLQIILRRFEWALLQALGLAISLKQEARGKGDILADRIYQCIPNVGFVESASGFSGAVIQAMEAGDWTQADVLPAAKRMMRLLLDDVLDGRVLKTRMLFRRSVGCEP